jgi:hypothetical protein
MEILENLNTLPVKICPLNHPEFRRPTVELVDAHHIYTFHVPIKSTGKTSNLAEEDLGQFIAGQIVLEI